MEKMKNIEQNGRQLVTVVRIRPVAFWESSAPVDFTDYKHPRIWAIIPGWKDANGVITSIKTGKVVPVTKRDEIRPESIGSAFDYEDGTKIIMTRGWHDDGNNDGKKIYGEFLAERKCRDSECIVIPAFGEGLTEPPKLD